MENVWEYRRVNKLSGCVRDNCGAILGACAEAWNWLIAQSREHPIHRTQNRATVNV